MELEGDHKAIGFNPLVKAGLYKNSKFLLARSNAETNIPHLCAFGFFFLDVELWTYPCKISFCCFSQVFEPIKISSNYILSICIHSFFSEL